MMYKADLLSVCGRFALFGAEMVLGNHLIDRAVFLGLTVVCCHVYTQTQFVQFEAHCEWKCLLLISPSCH